MTPFVAISQSQGSLVRDAKIARYGCGILSICVPDADLRLDFSRDTPPVSFFNCMSYIFSLSTPFKIFRAVVGFIGIFVVDAREIVRVFYKSLCNKALDFKCFLLSVFAQNKVAVSATINDTVNDLSSSKLGSALALRDVSSNSSYATKIADPVISFISDHISPNLIIQRKVGLFVAREKTGDNPLNICVLGDSVLAQAHNEETSRAKSDCHELSGEGHKIRFWMGNSAVQASHAREIRYFVESFVSRYCEPNFSFVCCSLGHDIPHSVGPMSCMYITNEATSRGTKGAYFKEISLCQ